MKYASAEDRTRARVLRLLLEQGPASAASLSERLDLTPAAIRRHLDALLADGSIAPRAERPGAVLRRGRGRPARVFAATAAGHARARQGYDDLALSALRLLDELGGVAAFTQRRTDALEHRYGAARNPAELAAAMSADGYGATVRAVASGEQLCQHHCPVADAAAAFPQLCDAETEAIGRVLGTHVQRLATIAHGDGVCTTHIPRAVRSTPTKEGARP